MEEISFRAVFSKSAAHTPGEGLNMGVFTNKTKALCKVDDPDRPKRLLAQVRAQQPIVDRKIKQQKLRKLKENRT